MLQLGKCCRIGSDNCGDGVANLTKSLTGLYPAVRAFTPVRDGLWSEAECGAAAGNESRITLHPIRATRKTAGGQNESTHCDLGADRRTTLARFRLGAS